VKIGGTLYNAILSTHKLCRAGALSDLNGQITSFFYKREGGTDKSMGKFSVFITGDLGLHPWFMDRSEGTAFPYMKFCGLTIAPKEQSPNRTGFWEYK
jgi:hypothetical protein